MSDTIPKNNPNVGWTLAILVGPQKEDKDIPPLTAAGDGLAAVWSLHGILGAASRHGDGGRVGRAVAVFDDEQAAGEPLEPDPCSAEPTQPRGRRRREGTLDGARADHGHRRKGGRHDAGEEEECLRFDCIFFFVVLLLVGSLSPF